MHDRVTGVSDGADERGRLFLFEMNEERDGKSRERAEDDNYKRKRRHSAIITQSSLVLEITTGGGASVVMC